MFSRSKFKRYIDTSPRGLILKMAAFGSARSANDFSKGTLARAADRAISSLEQYAAEDGTGVTLQSRSVEDTSVVGVRAAVGEAEELGDEVQGVTGAIVTPRIKGQPVGNSDRAVDFSMESLLSKHDILYESPAAATSIKAAHSMITQLKMTFTLNNGYRLPGLGLGTFSKRDSPAEMGKAVIRAIKLGYRHFDCAEAYRNEEEIGKAFLSATEDGIVERSQLFVTSKVWQTNHEPHRVREACLNSLRNLGVDYLDLYLMHWPLAWEYTNPELSPLVPTKIIDGCATVKMSTAGVSIMDTWRAMEELVDAGLVRSIGVSNFSSLQLADLLSYARHRPAVNQIECHPFFPQVNLRGMCRRNQIRIISYTPLGRPGNADGGPSLLKDPSVNAIAKKWQITPAQVLLNWQIRHGLAAIPKSTCEERMAENLSSINDDIQIDDEDMASLDGLNRRHRFCNKPWCYGALVFDD